MRRRTGFTLIELMIAIAIVAILAAVAVPSYSEYVRRGRVVDATSQLAGMRIKMEQYFQDKRSYVGACTPGVAPKPASTPSFTFDCDDPAPPSDTAYTVTANGVGSMTGAKYTINHLNQRVTVSPPNGWSPGGCGWVVKKDGSC